MKIYFAFKISGRFDNIKHQIIIIIIIIIIIYCSKDCGYRYFSHSEKVLD
jgi:hypothetical protein